MKHFFLATFVAAALAAPASLALAQGPPSHAGMPNIAIIDLTYIFENHQGFLARRESMRAEVQRAEDEVKRSRDEMKRLADKLEGFKPGSPEYKQLEEELSRLSANLNVNMQLKKKDFLLTEAKMYYAVYQEILDEVKLFAERNGIALVLRFNGEPIDTDNPQEVLKELNKSVVYHNRSIDITPIVLEQLNRRQANTNIGARPPANQQQVPPRR